MKNIKFEKFVSDNTDYYFKRSKGIISKNSDSIVTYAVFMRRPVIFCPKIAIDWLMQAAKTRETKFNIELCYQEGAWVGAGEPLMLLSGKLSELIDLETLYLQLLGPSCVAAYNAYSMCSDLPKTSFLAMDSRHCAGIEMHNLMAYGASVGSDKAKREKGAIGFIGSASNNTAHYFGSKTGVGTMPHAFIGYSGSTLRAAEMYNQEYPDDNLTVLVDYFGKEVSDSLEVCKSFKTKAKEGKLAIRLDTHGGRFVEGLDTEKSYEVLEKNAPESIRTYRTEEELRWMVGTGVSAAAIWFIRLALNREGWNNVKIIASSGFNPAKCKLFASINVPVDVIGTGSYLPDKWTETYATADIIKYDGNNLVKKGREFLFSVKKNINK